MTNFSAISHVLFDEMIMMSALYYTFTGWVKILNAISQQFKDRHVSPLWHIIMTLVNQSLFFFFAWCFVLSQQATVSFIFVMESYLCEWKRICWDFFLFVYISIAIADPIFKRAVSWDPILWFTPNTFLHLSQARIWISIDLYCGPFCFQWFEMRGSYSFCWYWWNFLPSLLLP